MYIVHSYIPKKYYWVDNNREETGTTPPPTKKKSRVLEGMTLAPQPVLTRDPTPFPSPLHSPVQRRSWC